MWCLSKKWKKEEFSGRASKESFEGEFPRGTYDLKLESRKVKNVEFRETLIWVAYNREYLEFVSPHGKGKTYHLVVVPIEGAINWSDDGTVKRQSSIFDYTGSGELFKAMGNTSSGNSVFLDFRSSDFFTSERMKMNFHYEIIELIPYHMFDGVLLLSELVEVEQEKE